MKQFSSGHAMQSAWVVDDLDAAVDAWLAWGSTRSFVWSTRRISSRRAPTAAVRARSQ